MRSRRSVSLSIVVGLASLAPVTLTPMTRAWAQAPNFTQPFASQGPAPSIGPTSVVQSAELGNGTGSVAGAIQAVLVDPSNPGILFLGATNGGIWQTTNGGTTWTPLTDRKTSLSIASLAFDSTDTTNKTIVASTGNVSNGIAGHERSGNFAGLLYTTNGGTSWQELGATTFDGISLTGAAARGSTFLVAAGDLHNSSASGGLYISTNGGTSFSLVSSSVLTPGQVTGLAGDQASSSTFYAAVSATASAQRGIYFSSNTGSSWTRVLAMDADEAAHVVTGKAAGTVVAALYNVDSNSAEFNKVTRVMVSADYGQSWRTITIPEGSSAQASINTAVAIDPNNSKVVYLAMAATDAEPHTLQAYRFTLNSDGTTTTERLTDAATADGSSVHADARTIVFDSNGRLLLGGDGGIYFRTVPASSLGVWGSLNSATLSVREINKVGYDAVSHRIVAASQDTGVAFQNSPGGALYDAIGPADGTNAVVNDRTISGRSAIYTSIQHIDLLTRRTYDARGNLVGKQVFGTAQGADNRLNFESDDYKVSGTTDPDDPQSNQPQLPFSSKLVGNRVDPTRLAFGTNYVYTTQDSGAASSTLTLLNRGQAGTVIGEVTALSYGTSDNTHAVLAGTSASDGGRLYLSTSNTANSLSRITAYSSSEAAPTSVVFDNRFASTFFVANGTKLFSTTDSGGALTDQTSNLTALDIKRPTAVEFISNNGVNSLLVGGLVSDATAQSPIAVVNSNGSGVLDGTSWKAFGSSLPNTVVNDLAYNSTADVLVASLWGRGAWVMYDVTSYFSTATTLQFGLADNDSSPDASYLSGARNLVKYGAGTLTVAGTTSYTGTTTVNAGTLMANASLASSSSLTIASSGTVRGTGTLPATTVNGTLAPGSNAVGTLTVQNGLTFKPGSVYQVAASNSAASRTNVTGGSATLDGTFQVVLQPGSYRPNRSYTVLTTSGGLSGAFAGTTTNYPFLRPSLGYEGSNVSLTVTPGGFAQGAQNANQASVGRVLDSNAATASGDFGTVIDAFSLLGSSQAPAAFEAISGQNYASFATMGVQTGQLFMGNFVQQAGSASNGSGTGGRIALAEACESYCELPPEPKWGAWGGGFGGFGTVAGSPSASGLSFGIGGFAAGLDRRFDNGLLVGVTAGYSNANSTMSTMPGSGRSNIVQGGLYATQSFGNAYVDALAGYAHADSQMVRPISIPGLATRTAIGLTGANQFFGQLEGGYRFELGGTLQPFVTPFLRLQGSTNSQAAFTETGADSLNLNVAAQTTNSLRSVLGAQFGGSVDLGWRDRLGLIARFGWSHEYADTARPVTASFAGAPASTFAVAGAEAPRDGAVLGLAANTAIADGLSVYARYDGELDGGNTSHIFSAGVRFVW